MFYSIGEISQLTGLSPHTLRYYEKEGLLFNVRRDENGVRLYSRKDIDLIEVLTCLKEAGLSIAELRHYIELLQQGADSYQARLKLFQKQRDILREKIAQLNNQLAMADYKTWYYQNIEKLGDEADPDNCQKMRALYEANKHK